VGLGCQTMKSFQMLKQQFGRVNFFDDQTISFCFFCGA